MPKTKIQIIHLICLALFFGFLFLTKPVFAANCGNGIKNCECGDTIITSVTAPPLSDHLACPGTGSALTVGASNITVACSEGVSIKNTNDILNNTPAGIGLEFLDSKSVVAVRGCKFINFATGIKLKTNNNTTIENNVFLNNGTGISGENAISNLKILNNDFLESENYGLYLKFLTAGNQIKDNRFTIYDLSATANVFLASPQGLDYVNNFSMAAGGGTPRQPYDLMINKEGGVAVSGVRVYNNVFSGLGISLGEGVAAGQIDWCENNQGNLLGMWAILGRPYTQPAGSDCEASERCTRADSLTNPFNLIKNTTICFSSGNLPPLVIGNNYIHLNCQYSSVAGSGSGIGITANNKNRVTIYHCQVKDFDRGIQLKNSRDFLLRSIIINNSKEFYLDVRADPYDITKFNHQIYNPYYSQSSSNLINNTGDIIYLYGENEVRISDVGSTGHVTVANSKNVNVSGVTITEAPVGYKAGDPIKFLNVTASGGTSGLANSKVANTLGGFYLAYSSGLTLTGNYSYDNEFGGGRVYQIANSTFSNNTFSENKYKCFEHPITHINICNGHGLYVEGGAGGHTFSGNYFTDNDGAGLAIFDADQNDILGNTVNGNGFLALPTFNPGLYLENSDDNIIDNNEIYNNKLSNLSLSASARNFIYGNKIGSSVDANGIYLVNSANTYAGYAGASAPPGANKPAPPYPIAGANQITDNKAHGIFLENSPNSHLYSNTVSLNYGNGILGSQSNSVVLNNNTVIFGLGQAGINILDSSDWDLDDNLINYRPKPSGAGDYTHAPYLNIGSAATPIVSDYRHRIPTANKAGVWGGELPIYYYYDNRLGGTGGGWLPVVSRVINGLATNHLQITNGSGFIVQNLNFEHADPLSLNFVSSADRANQVFNSNFIYCRKNCLHLWDTDGAAAVKNIFNTLTLYGADETGVLVESSAYNDFLNLSVFNVNSDNLIKRGGIYLFNSNNNVIRDSNFNYAPPYDPPDVLDAKNAWQDNNFRGEMYLEDSNSNNIYHNVFSKTGAFESPQSLVNSWCTVPFNTFNYQPGLKDYDLFKSNWPNRGGIPNGASACLSSDVVLDSVVQKLALRDDSISERTNARGLFDVSARFAQPQGRDLIAGMFYSQDGSAYNPAPEISGVDSATISPKPDRGTSGNYRLGALPPPVTDDPIKTQAFVPPNSPVYNQVVFDWNAASGGGLVGQDDNFYLVVRTQDLAGAVVSSVAISAPIDLKPPTLLSFTLISETGGGYAFSWAAAGEENWTAGNPAHYEIWYGVEEDEVQARADDGGDPQNGPYVWDDLTQVQRAGSLLPYETCTGGNGACYDSNLKNKSYAGTVLKSNVSPKFFQLCAIDNFGNETCRSAQLPSQVKPWLETRSGDLCGSGNLGSLAYESTGYSGTFLIQAGGTITNWSTSMAKPLGWSYVWPLTNYPCPNFPKSTNRYTGQIGSLDYLDHNNFNDILADLRKRYGSNKVVSLSGPSFNGTKDLGNKIYFWDGDVTINSALHFREGSGAGLILVNGNLAVNNKIDYAAGAVTKLTDIASVAWLVLGDINFSSSVTEAVGAFVALGQRGAAACPALSSPSNRCGRISTGDSANQLRVNGLLMAKQFNFQRTYASAAAGSEVIIFDSRVLANPPLGAEDITKALPVWQ